MSNLYKTYYDLSRLVIWGESSNSDSSSTKPRLIFSFRDGNPRITVYTGISGPRGVISFPSDYPTMVGVLNLLKDVIKGEPGIKFSIDSLTNVYIDNKLTSDKRIVGTLHIGKTKDGIIYLSVMAEDKPKLIFPIKPSSYHSFKDKDKNTMSESLISEKITEGIVDLYLNVLSNAILQYTNEEYTNGNRKPSPIRQNTQTTQQSSSNYEDISSDIDALNL